LPHFVTVLGGVIPVDCTLQAFAKQHFWLPTK
jgi:hypothetical protein